ncbi:FAD/NAD(P)-binding domain-containing protein [Gonapodya prolifera JEL478]|uniref:FAD/NAD(P)-binding domain-containing protein n=1 Tax=Gonapodya prolifera (strain JEL478) TaxID=1344416 RepID=A0A139A226_GONPJ|nr:FAD/NAD(P)-binding domain-containing protein [Gonapodya prolifera JEL478]|eukprot:KXS10822.1 FAD/NAD(P)-binding domain-containing protein [Gonapodya prolifera JEL478]
MEESKTVLVIGGGPAGALAALTLARQGLRPTIYEKRDTKAAPLDPLKPEPHPFWEIGATIDLCPNGSYALERLDAELYQEVLLNKTGTSKAFHMTLMDGSDLIRQQYVKHDGEHSKDIQILRSTYHRVLMDRCTKAKIPFVANKCVVKIEQTESQVTATFSDGTTASGDFLVAADGINSTCRILLFPDEPPVMKAGVGFVGLFDLGFTPDPATVPPLRFESNEPIMYTNTLNGSFVFGANCPEANIGSWVIAMIKQPEEVEEESDWNPVKDVPKQANHIADMVEKWGALKSASNAIRYSKRITPIWLSDVPDMKTLHKGRVIFIGDSGHGIPPTQGQGLSQSIEDCAVLNELIINFPNFSTSDHAAVFKLFDEIRLPRVHSVAAQSRMIMKQMYASSVMSMRIGRIFLKALFGVQNLFGLEDAVFGYKCDRDIAKVLAKYKKGSVASAA